MMRKFCSVAFGSLAASLLVTGLVVADVCEDPIQHQLLLETSSALGVPSQVLLANDLEELKNILIGLGIDPGPDFAIQFAGIKVLVVVGESRTNGCRSTDFLCVQSGNDPGEAQAVIEETFPGCDCTCTALFSGNAVFLVAVSADITSAELASIRNTINCKSCRPCPTIPTRPTGRGSVVIEPICP